LPGQEADVTGTAKREIPGMTLTPLFCGQPGRSMPSATAARKKSVAGSKCCRQKCRKRDGQKTVGRIKRRRVRVALPTDENVARLLIL